MFKFLDHYVFNLYIMAGIVAVNPLIRVFLLVCFYICAYETTEIAEN